MIHDTAQVEDDVEIGDGTAVWAQTQIRRGARIGDGGNIGRNVFIDVDVQVGHHVKIQNNASLFAGVTIGDGVFVGPHVIFTNDRVPRAANPDGSLKSGDDWVLGRTVVARGASIGAGAVVVTGVEIGEWSMVGAGTVVTRDVPAHALVLGNPGRVVGWVSASGVRCDTKQGALAATEAEIAEAT